MFMPSQTGRDVKRPWGESPIRRLLAELYCLSLVFRFHTDNNDGRKAATLLVVLAWAAIEVGAAYGVATLPNEVWYLRIAVGILIGRMWEIQINNVAGVGLSYNNSDGDKTDE